MQKVEFSKPQFVTIAVALLPDYNPVEHQFANIKRHPWQNLTKSNTFCDLRSQP